MSTVNLPFFGNNMGNLEPSDSSACSSLPLHLRIPDGSMKTPSWRCRLFAFLVDIALIVSKNVFSEHNETTVFLHQSTPYF